MPQELSLRLGQDAVGHVLGERQDAQRPLADRERRRAHHRWQHTQEALARLGQFGREDGQARMHLGAHMGRHEPDDAFGHWRGQVVARG